mgnify:CR=1 FL=1
MNQSTTQKKKSSKSSKKPAPVTKEGLVQLYGYSVSPGFTQMKLAAKALVCASFVGLSTERLIDLELEDSAEWVTLAGKGIIPITESAVLSMMSELESNGQADWSESDVGTLPKKVTEALALHKPVLNFIAETVEQLKKQEGKNLHRARFNLKKAVTIDTDQESYIEVFDRRIVNSLKGHDVLIGHLLGHVRKPAPANSKVASAIESFSI